MMMPPGNLWFNCIYTELYESLYDHPTYSQLYQGGGDLSMVFLRGLRKRPGR
jgi:hypothetical protein